METNNNLILLVDDDEDDRDLFSFAVQSLNLTYNFRALHDGTQLVDYLSDSANKLPAFIFLDLNMPKMTGFETLQWVRQKFNHQTLPVAIYSTSCEPDEVETASQLGANLYLQKPLDMKTLTYLIKNTVERSWVELTKYRHFVLLNAEKV